MASGTIKKGLVLLWENPNPDQALAAGTIYFSDNYALYLIIFKRDKNQTTELSTIFRHGHGVTLVAGSGYYNKLYERGYSWVSGGGLSYGNGFAGNSTGTTDCCNALAIYGINL